jgi:hypothetical protein
MDSKKLLKVAQIFCCNVCDYNTCKKSSFDKHISTVKHKKRENDSKMVENDSAKLQKVSHFECECGKIYKYDSGYYRHKKKCFESNNQTQKNEIIDKEEKNEPTDKEIIMMLIKDNSELKNMMMKVLENGTHNNNTTHTNSHNKSFNLQFFLNETCKDAMNMMEFVDSIKLQLSDLERVGELGYVEGISNIIVDNLKALDITQRPVHCTDKKRETLYIKDENKWEKDEEKKKMHTMVKKIAYKNARLLPKFKEEHPDCGKSSSKFSDQYNKIIVESMGGPGVNDYEKEEKIIKKVSKEVIVEKEQVEL